MPAPIAAYWILLAGALMPYPLVMVAKAGKAYDNTDPRNPKVLDTALKQRGHGAHANALEAFPLFAAAVLLAGVRHAPAGIVDALAWLWLVARVAYSACYLAGLGTPRSLSWVVAAGAAVAILVIAILQGS